MSILYHFAQLQHFKKNYSIVNKITKWPEKRIDPLKVQFDDSLNIKYPTN